MEMPPTLRSNSSDQYLQSEEESGGAEGGGCEREGWREETRWNVV